MHRPFWNDVGRSIAVSLAAFAVLAVLAGLALGWAAIATNAIAFPVALIIVMPVVVAVVYPMFTARVIGVTDQGFEVVRYRRSESYPWSSLRLGSRPRWHPFFGRRYLAVVEPPGAKAGRLLVLTPDQFVLLGERQPRQREARPGRRRRRP